MSRFLDDESGNEPIRSHIREVIKELGVPVLHDRVPLSHLTQFDP